MAMPRILSIITNLALLSSFFPVSDTTPYIKGSTSLSWNDAEAFCQKTYGTHLATITSDAEARIASETAGSWAWIGLNRLSGSWKWSDGKTGCDYVSSNDCKYDPRWGSGEPTEGNEQCAYIGGSGRYNDNPCSTKVPVLCNSPFGRWTMGAKGATCDKTCQSKELLCDADKQSTLTSQIAMKHAFSDAGYDCKSFHGHRDYPGTPFSTGRNNDDCAPLKAGSKSVCNANALSYHSPLCYCKPRVYDYPSCLPGCLDRHARYGSIYQKEGAIYRVAGKCYLALSYCWGCLDNPRGGDNIHLKSIGCPDAPSDIGCIDLKWQQISGGLEEVSVATDGTVWGTNSGDAIYRRDGQSWTRIGGGLEQIDVGSASLIYGVNSAHNIFQYKSGKWTQLSGGLEHISVASDGTVWGINKADQIYRRNGQSWTRVSGGLVQIDVGSSRNVWGVNRHGKVFKYNNNGGWIGKSGDGQLSHVSVGSDGVVMGVNAQKNIFVYDSKSNDWKSVCGALNYIEVGSQSEIWGIADGGKIYKATVDAPADIKYIGCYKDTSSRALRYGPSRTNPAAYGYFTMSCSDACKNYKYFSLQHGGQCFCENALSHATKYGKSSYCKSDRRGGGWANDIFQHKW